VVAAICQARALFDQLVLQGDGFVANSADAAVLNNDAMIFRRAVEHLEELDLVMVSLLAARLGRPHFVMKPIKSQDQVWLSEEYFLLRNVKRVAFPSVLILDRDEQPPEALTVSHEVIAKELLLVFGASVREIRVLGDWERWETGPTVMSDLCPNLEMIDASKACLRFIQKGSFAGCWNLRAAKFARGLMRLDDEVFSYCCQLTEVALPDTVTEIGSRAFLCCVSLKVAKLGKGLKTLGTGAFCWCGNLIEIILPDGVSEVAPATFQECTSLSAVKFGNGLMKVGQMAFSDCESLFEIVLPDTVTEIEGWAFQRCISLKAVKVGKGLKTIGMYAFYKCKSLVEIVLPDTLVRVGDGAFYNCTSLKTLSLGRAVGSLANFGKWLPDRLSYLFHSESG
jgi:hypothetical protein